MTTCVTPPHSRGRVTRTVLGWFDNDEIVSPEDARSGALEIAGVESVAGGGEEPVRHDLGMFLAPPSVVDRGRDQIREYKQAIAGIYTSDLATYGLDAASAASSQARTYGAELAGLFDGGSVAGITDGLRDLAMYSHEVHVMSHTQAVGAEFARLLDTPSLVALMQGYRDFYSTAWADLAQVTLTIESINNTVRETLRGLVSAYVRDHGHADYEVADDAESTGLAWTDTAGDYPPLPRKYADVKVSISGADKVKPRTYSDEDHQVWGL